MKAVQIHRYGHAEQMTMARVTRPKAGAGQILVKIHDAGVNPVDWKIREGYMKDVRPASFPFTMGQDFSGEVVAVGAGVSGFGKGDKVFGLAEGTYAEYALATPNGLAHLPASVDPVDAASIPTAGLTAWQIVMDVAKLTNGQAVLIHGAAGGVGSFAVQFARLAGARVIASASRDDYPYLQDLGVEQLVDYKSEQFEEKVENVDVVIDLVGGDTLMRSYGVVKPNGLVITTVGPADEAEAKKHKARVVQFVMRRDAADELERIGRFVEEGVVKPRVSRIMPLSEARNAEDLSQLGHPHGKLILRVA
ncbi:MAG: NADP-dependent oxidoreductase [Gammaproteobacteria bacterium]|jgi:NADPH:quinone reductase-like Zn-dependent oxidoreductase